ncbi:stimulated by retinoic acid gene 6 protein-like [Diadema antillarum]|uniref:stimulated by retinoic acid gene 6 protein-like n=1 Tax=Diadema antillarum TaxID=105358 RepID=UPI003A83783B
MRTKKEFSLTGISILLLFVLAGIFGCVVVFVQSTGPLTTVRNTRSNRLPSSQNIPIDFDLNWTDIEDTATNISQGTCENPTFTVQQWTIWNLPIAATIIVFFSFFQPRKRLFPNCCGGKPSVAYPVNLLDTYSDRPAFLCAFGICCIGILDLFTGNFYLEPNYDDLPEMVQGAVRSCMAYVNVFAIALAHYPIMVSLTVQNWVVSDVIGLLYTLEWAFMYWYTLAECPWNESDEGNVNRLILIPVYIMYVILAILFIKRSYHNHKIRKLRREGLEAQVHELHFEDTHYYERVKYLLTPKARFEKNRPEPGKFRKLINKIYESEPGFRYSRRIVCTIGLSALCLYCVGIIYEATEVALQRWLDTTFAEDGDLFEFYDQDNDTDTFYEWKELFDTVVYTFSPTVFTSMSIMICYSFIAFITYRRNTICLWRGDRSFCPNEHFKNTSLVVSSFKYSGFHIGFVLWGFILIQLVLWLLVFLITYLLVLPLVNGELNWVWVIIKNQWLTVVVYLVIYYAQVFAARFLFLREKGKELSINNRRLFHVQVYFFFFFNVILGLASCLLRIFKSVLFGLLLVGRIDRCLLMRGFELFDSGYKAYLGFLQLEVAHTHPVVITFCHFLLQTQKERKDKLLEFSEKDDVDMSTRRSPDKRARIRWHLAMTLLKNNHLLSDRLAAILEARREELRKQVREEMEKQEKESIESAVEPLDDVADEGGEKSNKEGSPVIMVKPDSGHSSREVSEDDVERQKSDTTTIDQHSIASTTYLILEDDGVTSAGSKRPTPKDQLDGISQPSSIRSSTCWAEQSSTDGQSQGAPIAMVDMATVDSNDGRADGSDVIMEDNGENKSPP